MKNYRCHSPFKMIITYDVYSRNVVNVWHAGYLLYKRHVCSYNASDWPAGPGVTYSKP